jgi:hypothetical protein
MPPQIGGCGRGKAISCASCFREVCMRRQVVIQQRQVKNAM